ncbi:hypothetical protein Pla110_16460 [Polystyrenella longa]|uniref:Gamma-butyrobetaine hydroxylase-like N-terminal domain-containing protein n=1 Tax=Polystyrenella longa TaxID=2528007 RepID=A0A518CL30_9PLAN|nr:DUF971 domain-containing protein [Polystyrenella longa]QDU79926.1 hypothetical protein Pla110_16460 [Polystyrenella longa]
MAAPPQNIRALKDKSVLEIVWPLERVDQLPFQFLRGRCPCAVCVNELTGVRMVGPENIGSDVHPVKMGFSGNYALTVEWSDGHHTGLFTWDYLETISNEWRDANA